MATFGTFVTGQVLTAAELNAGLLWTSFTPSFTNFTLGNGTVSAKYSIFGKFMWVKLKVTLGSTSSMGDPLLMTMPASAQMVTATQEVLGTFQMQDTGNATYFGSLSLSSATQIRPYVWNVAGTFPVANTVNTTRPFTWGNTDQFTMDFMVEIS